MKTINVSRTVTNALMLSVPLLTIAQHKVERPNVVIIMADDLDSEQLSCYGGKNIQTPNIDELATQGLKFQNSNCTTCKMTLTN